MTWYKGWGFWYDSPDGSINSATNTSTTDPTTGVITPVGSNPNSAQITSPGTTPLATDQPAVSASGYTASDMSAKATLDQTLSDYGLQGLGDFAWQEYLKNIPVEQIMLDIRQTPQYKARFPAMAALSTKGQAISEAQYINYETSAAQLMTAAGLPKGFYDQPEDFTAFLENNIALPELQERINNAKTAVYNSDPGTLQALHDWYGVNQAPGNPIGDATAYFLDPTRAEPAIQQNLIAAQEAGSAARAGYQNLSQSEAEHLAQLGIDPTTAQKSFGTLASLMPLFHSLPGEAGAVPTQAQGLSATFEDNAAAQLAITNQQSKRKAAFGGGGGFDQAQTGMTGL